MFIDTCLSFGLHLAPKIFGATADALEWIIANELGSDLCHPFLDDFLYGGSPGSDNCKIWHFTCTVCLVSLSLVYQTTPFPSTGCITSPAVVHPVLGKGVVWYMRRGFPLMSEKVFGPSTSLEFLGFLVDTIAIEIMQASRHKTKVFPSIIDPQEVMFKMRTAILLQCCG